MAVVVYVGMTIFIYRNSVIHQPPLLPSDPRPEYIAKFPPDIAFLLGLFWALAAFAVTIVLWFTVLALRDFVRHHRKA
jgi:hypothetical protein